MNVGSSDDERQGDRGSLEEILFFSLLESLFRHFMRPSTWGKLHHRVEAVGRCCKQA